MVNCVARDNSVKLMHLAVKDFKILLLNCFWVQFNMLLIFHCSKFLDNGKVHTFYWGLEMNNQS